MQIYNKTCFWIGIVLFNVCVYCDFSKDIRSTYLLIPMALGVIIMLIGFKKPKQLKINTCQSCSITEKKGSKIPANENPTHFPPQLRKNHSQRFKPAHITQSTASKTKQASPNEKDHLFRRPPG